MIHSFDTRIAEKYGVHCAIILQNLYYWIEKNKANDKHFYDGYYWTYNSKKAFAELFPYMNERQVSYALKKLVNDGILITGNYNKVAYDRTLWYAITKVGYSIIQNCTMEKTKLSNRTNNIVEPIPNINTNTKNTNNKQKEIYKEKNDNAKIIEKPKERKSKKKEKIFNLLEKHYDEYGIDNEIVIEKLEKFFSNMLDDNRMITEDMIIATLTSLAKVSPDTQIKAIQLSLDKGYKSISPDYLNGLQSNFKPNNTYHNSNEVVQSQSDYNKQLNEYKNKNLKTF